MGRRMSDGKQSTWAHSLLFSPKMLPAGLAGAIILLLVLLVFTGCDQNPLIDDLKTILDSEGKKVADPEFSVKGGDYYEQENVELELSCDTDGAEIRYTTDGSEPSPEKGEKYNDGDTIALSESMTVKAVAHKKYWDSSNVVKEEYSITVMPDGFDYVLDTSFGDDGVVVYDDPGGDDTYGKGLTMDSYGNIVVCGFKDRTYDDAMIWRYDPSGSIDTSFSGDGLKIYGPGEEVFSFYDITVDLNENIVATGVFRDGLNLGDYGAVYRCDHNGNSDNSGFFSNGIITLSTVGTFLNGIISDGSGKIVCVGESSRDMLIWKLNEDGSPYAPIGGGFAADGTVIFDDSDTNRGQGIASTPSNDIVCTGEISKGIECDIPLWWYDEDGNPRTTGAFLDGMVSFGTSLDECGQDLTFDSNGNLFIVGTTVNETSHSNMAIWARQNDGSPLTSFGDNGKIIFSNLEKSWGYALVIDSSNNIIVTGRFSHNGNNGIIICKYKPNGELDDGYYSDGYIVYDYNGSVDARDIAIDSQNRITVAGYADGNMMLWRYKPRD